MLNKIIGFSVANKLLVGLFVVALTAYGSYELTQLPIDAVPDITNNQVQVITVAPSFGATDIERLVTFPVEQANSNIAGLREIRSFSRFGLSLVTIVFDDQTDIYWARQQVSERLLNIRDEIPQGIGTPELGPISTGLGEIYQYVVRPKEGYEHRYNETDLRTIQDWIVRRQLLGVKGVAEVSSFGGKLKQYAVEVSPEKLLSYGVTITEVFDALEANNQNTGGAYIEKGPTVLYIRSEGLAENAEDIQNIAVKSLADGQPLFIRDVAEVKTGFAPRYGALCYNDKGEVAGAVVMMLKGANSSEVIRNVKERIALIQRTLPEGVVIEPFLDRTKMVNHAIGTVEKNLLEGALIVVFVLVLFLGNLRAGLLVASVIPLSMLFAVIMMNTFGVSGNLMSLGALDFGLIVDGAVIIVEAVMHQISRNPKFMGVTRLTQRRMDAEVNESANRMMNSAVFGQVIILIVYLPIFSLQGIEGKMFRPMAQTVAFALLGAFLLSVTYVPMMSALLLSKKIKQEPGFSDRMMAWAEGRYRQALARVLGFPKIILACVLVLFAASLFTLSGLGGEFIPALEEGDFAVDTRVLTGSNLTTTIEHTRKAARILKTGFPEVLQVVTKIGSGEIPTDPMPMEASDLMVILKDKETWTSASTFPELADKMSKALKAVPGITTGFQYPVQMRFNELMTGARQDVVCKIFGEDLDTLAHFAKKLGTLVNQVSGTRDLYVEAVSGLPQLTIRYNRSAIARYGLTVGAVNRIVNTALAGQRAGLIFEGEKRFDLVVRLSGTERKNVDDIRKLLVPTAEGLQVPLSLLADVRVRNGPNQIQREDAKRRIIVGFNVGDRDVQSIVGELQAKVNRNLALPAGYYVTYGGSFENLNAARQRLLVAVPVSLVLIFVLLFFAFNSVKEGLLIYTAIPMSAIGGIFFLALRGMPFSVSAGIGFIALFGVAVLNGIVLVSEFNRIRNAGMTNLREVVMEGACHRLRPVLMTASVASLGFLPMAFSNGAGAEVQRPLATVVIGGLIVATFLTLFVLPLLYLLVEKGFRPAGKKPDRSGRAGGPGNALMLAPLFLAVTAGLQAQSPVALSDAQAMAQANNRQLKSEKLSVTYRKALLKTAFDPPQAGLQAEAGQINSIYGDTRFGFSQTFQIPVVYARQRRLLAEALESSMLNVAVKENELRRNVAQVYYLLLYQREKIKLLESLDSLFTEFSERANERLQLGEAGILEKTSAETQLGQIRIQLEQLRADAGVSRLQFQLLLNSPVPVEPASAASRFPVQSLPDSVPVGSHPQARFLEQQQQLAAATVAVEKSGLLPILSAGYNNMSMRGTGADDRWYGASRRFQSVQLGIGIPLFAGAQKARVNSAGIALQIAGQNYSAGVQALKNRYETLLAEYRKFAASAAYYESGALANARLIAHTAREQLQNGAINYLEWVQLIGQSASIRSQYLDILLNLNSKAIELSYFIEN